MALIVLLFVLGFVAIIYGIANPSDKTAARTRLGRLCRYWSHQYLYGVKGLGFSTCVGLKPLVRQSLGTLLLINYYVKTVGR